MLSLHSPVANALNGLMVFPKKQAEIRWPRDNLFVMLNTIALLPGVTDDDGWLYHCLTPQQHLRSYRGHDDDDGEIRTRRKPINGDKMGILLVNKWETVILRATSQTQWSIQQHYVFQPGHFVSWGLRQEVWTGRL